ncbi:hypothetical protein [Sphingobium sp. KCTC 72723]|uniref:hypothetical protein n=1 Tax=Sphingobium sp. KCTC 72723 TaxID=2733867 RepID=UPI0021D39F7C|nr:hypothetical protein [Sphingobium sp. KCTC 72723]
MYAIHLLRAHGLMDLPNLYVWFIKWVGDGTGLPDTILHIHAGMIIFILARAVSARSLGSLFPISCVIAAELLNEIMDRLHYGSWRWPDTIGDVVNTLFWPVIICIAVRVRPLLERKRATVQQDLEVVSREVV